ncbi:MAG: methyltransferase domain-containing protein, partial [Nanoarchaeota archaeon]|nr:methyltransferase domain-containing protein [Nanoarchaeota archaeon]
TSLKDKYYFVEIEPEKDPYIGAPPKNKKKIQTNIQALRDIRENVIFGAAETNYDLVAQLENAMKGLEINSLDTILKAFEKVDRAEFLPDDLDMSAKAQNGIDGLTPYAHYVINFMERQTIPSPNILLRDLIYMDIAALNGQKDMKILEIGTGSGYYASLLAEVAGEKTQIYTTEIRPEIAEFARGNIERQGYLGRVHVKDAKETELGWSDEDNKYDRIVTTIAATDEVHIEQLLDQLAEGGMLEISVIALDDDAGGLIPWKPGNEVLNEDRMVKYPEKKGYAYTSSHFFRKTKPEKNSRKSDEKPQIDYWYEFNCNLEIKTGIGPYFTTTPDGRHTTK